MIPRVVAKVKAWGQQEYFWIAVLTVFTAIMHFSIIMYPNAIVLDEVYYVNDVRGFLDGGITLRAEHPPLAETFIKWGMQLFGDNAFGWRFFGVLMGSGLIFLFYLICRRANMTRWAALFASTLLAFEVLTFTQSSVVMPDVFMVFFMILSLWLYLRGSYPLAVLAGVLATLCKMPGLLIFIIIGFHWLAMRRDRWPVFIGSALAAPILFLALLPAFDYINTGWWYPPLERSYNLVTMSASVTFAYAKHPSAFRPWDWFIMVKGMPYNYHPMYLGIFSPTMWGLAIPSVAYLVWKTIKGNATAILGFIWFAVTYLLWLPLVLTTDRVTYPYYMVPLVGAFAIALGLGFAELYEFGKSRPPGKLRKFALIAPYVFLIAHFGVFVGLTTVFTRI